MELPEVVNVRLLRLLDLIADHQNQIAGPTQDPLGELELVLPELLDRYGRKDDEIAASREKIDELEEAITDRDRDLEAARAKLAQLELGDG